MKSGPLRDLGINLGNNLFLMLKRIEVKEIINISRKLVNLSHLQLELKHEIIDLNQINLNLGKFMWFHEIKEIYQNLSFK